MLKTTPVCCSIAWFKYWWPDERGEEDHAAGAGIILYRDNILLLIAKSVNDDDPPGNRLRAVLCTSFETPTKGSLDYNLNFIQTTARSAGWGCCHVDHEGGCSST